PLHRRRARLRGRGDRAPCHPPGDCPRPAPVGQQTGLAATEAAWQHPAVGATHASPLPNQRETMTSNTLRIGILMGSDSDWPVMEEAHKICQRFGVGAEVRVLSAHRRPDEVADYAKSAVERGLKVLVAGAGGAAHLPGVLAAFTHLPVVGVPVQSKDLGG